MNRVLSLAAGTVLDAGPAGTLRAAADAGYDAAGLRLDPQDAGATGLRALADDLGLAVLDLEVARLGPDTRFADHLRLLELAQELGARFLLAVSVHPDPAATADELGRLAAAAEGGPTRVALEFMRFTRVGTLDEAVDVATAASAVVLVDALHLARGGDTPD
ncbi:MAG: TIM barrel protein, partial [Actinomycetota bacterium]|nr:TIM barrel protein [Actinomycetota bacterium]